MIFFQAGSMLAVEMGSRRGRKDQSQQSSKCGSNQSLNGGLGTGVGYHPFYQLHPAWSPNPDPGYSGNTVVQPLTQKHLQQHQEIMQWQHSPHPNDLYRYPPPQQHHQKRSKSKDSSKKNEKSGFWNKSKGRSKSEHRDKDKEKDEKALRAEQILRYQKAKEAAEKREREAAERKKAAEAAEKKAAEKAAFFRDDKRRKSGDSLSHLKFWKSKRKSISDIPRSSSENVSKPKRNSFAEYPVQSAPTTPQPVDTQHATEHVNIHLVQPPEQVEIVSVPSSTPVPELPADEVIVKEPDHVEVDDDTKDKENLSRKASRRSKSADSSRMKSSDSGFYSSRSKSPDSKLERKKSWKREKSLESIKSKGSMVKSYESVCSEDRKGKDFVEHVQRSDSMRSVKSKASVAKSIDSLQHSVKTEPVSNPPPGLRTVSSYPASLHSMDRNNNGRR